MLVVVCYDISFEEQKAGQTRLRRLAKLCEDHGRRVQYSVFEFDITPDVWVELKNKILKTILTGKDSIRIYYLGSSKKMQIEHFGPKNFLDFNQPLIL